MEMRLGGRICDLYPGGYVRSRRGSSSRSPTRQEGVVGVGRPHVSLGVGADAGAGMGADARALDVRDVCRQLIRELRGSPYGPPVELTQDSILVAEGLTPSDLLALDRRFLKGLALSKTGGTSHTVILARSFGIPCVIEIADFPITRWEGQEEIVDGELGLVAVELTAAARRYFEMEQWRLQARSARAHARVRVMRARPCACACDARAPMRVCV